MAGWSEVVASAPEFAAAVQRLFDAGRHKTVATLRVDGSPRISGIEASFTGGDLCFGSMPGSRKGADLARDPRFALHSPSVDPPDDPTTWPGDAKISGWAVLVTEPDVAAAVLEAQPGHTYRAEITEVVRTRVGIPPDHLVVELWRPGRELRRVERR